MEDEVVKIKVLLADDHSVVRSGIRQFLEDDGRIEVVAEAENGQEAQKFMGKIEIDVAVLDIQMPIMNGIELTRWSRQNYPEIGIMILTAYDDDPYIKAVLQAGANGFILKTATPEAIVKGVLDVAEGKSVLDTKVTHKLLAQMASESKVQGIYEELTSREMEVLVLTAQGYTNKATGIQLGISDRTVQGHLAHIFNKLQASSRTEAVMRAVTLGWLPANINEVN